MTANTDPIGNFLGVTPESKSEIIPLEPTAIAVANTVVIDIDYARGNMLKLLEDGHQMLDGLFELAEQAQSAKVYEVATNLLKTMAQTNLDLIELQVKKRSLIPSPTGDNNSGPRVINNNLIISTNDLLKAIKNKLIDGETQ